MTSERTGQPLRILRVASDLYPEALGGVELHAHHMSRIQAEMGHNVTVLTSDHGEDKPWKERRDGYEILRHRELCRPLGNSIIPGLVKTLLKRADEYDIIHAHSHLFFSTNLTSLFCRFTDAPLVITNHGLFSQTAPRWLQKGFIPLVARPTLNASDRVICYTETDRERLHERRVTSSISVVHNGIDCSTFSPDENYEPKEESNVQILFVGRLNENKGPTRLLDAFASISEDYPDVSLTIVGEGPQLDDLDKKRRQENLTKRVELLGYVPNEELPQLYNNSSLFVLPSLNEGLPRTVLEAMACETPIITSTLPQLELLVEEAGLTVSRGATTELEQALRTLLDDPDRRSKMGTIGRKRIVEQYSWRETVRKTIDVYRQCLHQ